MMILTQISHYPAHSFIYFVHSCFSAVFLSAYKFSKNTKHYYFIHRVRISPLTNNILFLYKSSSPLWLYNLCHDIYIKTMQVIKILQ